MPRFVAVHGHFYQPPREDPATGEVAVEPEAAPYHDFNEKITAECYRPNASLGNFDRLSFDLGPTLGQWLNRRHPDVLRRIAAADRRAVDDTGYGNALMQSYHHSILPLANARDRRTELRWGARWFEHAFGRRPTGIWLPETAVDLATLEACADEGLTFTILSPQQAASEIDSRYPYTVSLPSSREFHIVFYESGLSGTISFDPVATNSAEEFLRRFVLPRYDESADPDDPQLIAIASDGEVYGHHHPFKDYFLQDLLYARAPEAGLEVISLEAFLARKHQHREVVLKERSSWGCGHQLLRWSGDCACTPGSGEWKSGLRQALDNLAERVDDLTERLGGPGIWALRDDYIDVVIGAATLPDWLSAHGLAPESDAARTTVELLEAQQHRLAMYASCAFYWDDLTRIEAGYGVRSALYAAGRLDAAFSADLTAGFTGDLESVVGWKSAHSAAALYAGATKRAR